jgi:hypothetical protein
MPNPNCDGGGPHAPGEVRLLSTGGDSNAILCHACYLRELQWRRIRNLELAEHMKFKLPAWSELEPYEV